MSILDLENEVRDIAIRELSLNPNTFNMATPLVHVNNVDSLDFVHLMVTYEERFELELEDALHPRIACLNDLVRILITEKGVTIA